MITILSNFLTLDSQNQHKPLRRFKPGMLAVSTRIANAIDLPALFKGHTLYHLERD